MLNKFLREKPWKIIQNEFVEIGGVNTLMFALHSTDSHIVKESLLAICQLCQDNEDVMVHVLGENGSVILPSAIFHLKSPVFSKSVRQCQIQ